VWFQHLALKIAPRSRRRSLKRTGSPGWLVAPLVLEATTAQAAVSLACGLALVLLSFPRGPVQERYGGWSRCIV
jgi:hypothetical protein